MKGFAGVEIAGAGYINARLDRGAAVAAIAADRRRLRRRASVRWSSIRASIPIRRRILGICGMPFWAIRFCGCCGGLGKAGGCSELHRQYRRAGGGCCRWAGASGGQDAGEFAELLTELMETQRSDRLLLLGPVCAGFAVVCGVDAMRARRRRRAAEAGSAGYAACARRGRE